VAGGLGNLALRETLDKAVHGTRAVLAITGAPPLATIPYIATKVDRRRRILRGLGWFFGIVFGLVAGAAAVHFFVMPLDVLWFVILQRIELVIFSLGHPTS
jgi:hypothetical protein